MKKRLKKLLVSWLLPTAEDITEFAVDTTANFVNGSGKEEVIAKYGTYADNFTQIQAKVTSWLRDGKIDDNEKKELYNAIFPLADKLIEEIKK